MLEWAFVLGQSFPEAVDLLVKGPRIEKRVGNALHTLEKHEAPDRHPESVLRLLDWLLEERGNQWVDSVKIETVLFRLPRRKEFLPLLNSICQRLASSGYTGAAALKRRIEGEFTLE